MTAQIAMKTVMASRHPPVVITCRKTSGKVAPPTLVPINVIPTAIPRYRLNQRVTTNIVGTCPAQTWDNANTM